MSTSGSPEDVEARSEFVKNTRDTAEDAFNAFEAVEQSFHDNIKRFESRQNQEVAESELWDKQPENYGVDTSFQDIGHDISDIELRVALDGVEEHSSIGSGNLSEYMEEMENKLGSVRERRELVQEKADMLESGEDAAKDDLLEQLLRGTDRHEEPEPESLNNSAAAENNRTLEDLESLSGNGVSLLEAHDAQLDRIERAYEGHVEAVAQEYHEDAKEQVRETAKGFRNAVEEFVDVARAITSVRDNTLEDPEFLSDEVAGQEPVLEAGEDALYAQANRVVGYVHELAEASRDIEHVAGRLAGVLEDDDLDCMKGTAEVIRGDLAAKIAAEAGEYVEEAEYGEDNYSDNYAEVIVRAVNDVMAEAGLEPEVENLDESMLEDEYGLRA